MYCDIPYNQKKVKKESYYGLDFNTEDFYKWAKTRDFPVYFSSVFCEDSDFQEVWAKEKPLNNNNAPTTLVVIIYLLIFLFI